MIQSSAVIIHTASYAKAVVMPVDTQALSDWAKTVFEAALGLLALALVGGLSFMVWNAARSNGFVIESFAVPPDLAARGLTGDVVAGRLLDRLTVVTAPGGNTANAAQTISSSSADDVKVEIPETGISLGELYRFLRRWLGHEKVVSGEVLRDAQGLAIGVRINGREGATYQAAEADLDTLLQKAAEHVFDVTMPSGYAAWLMAQRPPREAEMQAVHQRVLSDPAATPQMRAAALNGLVVYTLNLGDLRQAVTFYQRARETDPTMALGFTNAVGAELLLGHPETALALLPQALAALEKNHDVYAPRVVASIRAALHAQDADLRGDYAGGVAGFQAAAAEEPTGTYRQYNSLLGVAWDRARLHDGNAIAWMAEQPQQSIAASDRRLPLILRPYRTEVALQHWSRVIAMAANSKGVLAQAGLNEVGRKTYSTVLLGPWAALAKAKIGDITGAENLIAATQGDCNDCVRIRGQIASEARQWTRADYWFAKAVHDAPSIPMAHEDWGRSLLARGKADASLEQFKTANRLGPHFADALQGWGEALMAKNQSHLALAKFAEAEKYAPNWGRLHLKWGEALIYAGKLDEAKVQFARAAQLDLSPAEKAELAPQSPHG
jgi:tetratricopeptide (TPR) repeat protein